jgi:hypothetical protein
MKIVTCRRCGARIVFLRTIKGNAMPVDAGTVKEGDTLFLKHEGHMPHWATCKFANEFRKHKKKGEQ